VSPRTDDAHLRKVLANLEITSRTQLARPLLNRWDPPIEPTAPPNGRRMRGPRPLHTGMAQAVAGSVTLPNAAWSRMPATGTARTAAHNPPCRRSGLRPRRVAVARVSLSMPCGTPTPW